MSILTSFVLPMSSLCLENAWPYSSHSSSNLQQMSAETSLSWRWTFLWPGTSAGEQIKAVLLGISGNVSWCCGTQFLGWARCSLILSSLASSMLYTSTVGSSTKATTVSLPIYKWSTWLRLKILRGMYFGLNAFPGLSTQLGEYVH